MPLRFITFFNSMLGSFGFSSSEFYTHYVRWLQKRMRPQTMIWTEEQLEEATKIAAQIDKIPLSDLMDEFTKEDLIDAINIRDFRQIEKILRAIEVDTLTPWWVPILRLGIALALDYCTPDLIRQSCANLLGPTVIWD